MSRISLASRLRAAAVDYVHAPACRRCRLRSRAGKLPVPITFTRRQAASADYVHAPASCRCRLRSRAGKLPVPITFTRRQAASADYVHAPASCRCRLRSRAVKRAYFVLTYTAMHAHPVRRRTAPVSYIRRHAPCGALYGYFIKIYKFFFLLNFAAPNI